MKFRRLRLSAIVVIGLVVGLFCSSAYALVPDINTGVDVNTSGGVPSDGSFPPGDGSFPPSINNDGRYIAFGSAATNIVSNPNISGEYGEIYVRDTVNGTTQLASMDTSGDPADANSYEPYLSSTGRYVVYVSTANNLTSTSSSHTNIFLYDSETGETQLVDTTSSGSLVSGNASYPSVSADGNEVEFTFTSTGSSDLVSSPSLPANTYHTFVKNMSTGAVTLVDSGLGGSAPNAASENSRIDCSGDEVVFDSEATNLVSNDSGNQDVYLDNLSTSTLTDLTASSNGLSFADSISCDGGYVGLASTASNLTSASITNGHANGYEYSISTGDFTLVSQSSSGTVADNDANDVDISNGGEYVSFSSSATNLVSGASNTSNVYLRDVINGTTQLVSASSSGTGGNGSSLYSEMSSDGRYITYDSVATNLVPGYYYPGYDLIFDSQTGVGSPEPTNFTANNGSTFSRQSTPFTSGVATQTVNSDGSITVAVNDAPGYADSGFYLYDGPLSGLPDFTVNSSSGDFGLNLWFDNASLGDFFQWDGSGVMTSLGGDTYGLSSGSTDGILSVNGDTSFYMMNNGENYTLSQLQAGDDSAVSPSTNVAIWVGVDVGSGGSTSATISSIEGL